MKKIIFKRGLVATTALFTLAFIAPVAVNAQADNSHKVQAQSQVNRADTEKVAQQNQLPAQSTQQTGSETQKTSQEKRDKAQTRLEAAKLKACQNREKAIKNIMTRVSNRGTKQIDVFTKISDRTQAFYNEKGNKLDNYDALLAEVENKKADAQAAIDTVISDSSEFKCEGDNPKAVVNSFKDDMKAMNSALKEYKTAVKNLIVGVKSVQSKTSTDGSQEQ